MRSLIVRFKDCEGPGILLDSLKERNYKITYHNAYDSRVRPFPDAHLVFDLVVLLGGPQSVTDPTLVPFFEPWLNLVRYTASMPNRKVIGICLGAQIISKALGGEVRRGEKGPEVGFYDVQVQEPTHLVFDGITSFPAFHLHEDIFSIPQRAKHLLKSEMYSNQMFSFQDRIFGIQCHMEVTASMLKVWRVVHSDFIRSWVPGPDTEILRSQMENVGRRVFAAILDLTPDSTVDRSAFIPQSPDFVAAENG
ncbi:type 1 glutamine amidotransferase [Leptospira borgpetersenii]|uniref:Glutamine amidotransferase n=2 Tax=Leptospira borgpetersenii serovar Hardjo-bovis TaxID=338217 RepID=Q04SJ7_LEPBJ|nr:type 1 glutamine amidotransferase [Leptospira borgpetersenii]ABJ76123.1 Glutamine amidotransferase [Leptospira borgpetersenii serovar Hardjo-bovis str. JB197]ABJ79222.1 Glutamine amidotransferase [Leptospira borgpetersenii serovar Hardjo-bovis str. L550]AMX58531.1 glutamine amidotransferase [Leptospira borgpetersenii serovar Hardjo]AMX61784.1 glutamine amidotransferase [Leptospira borgpetersenii serovar Hardjo]AMX65028.1 glutamine amidotransferase [Leptospira borgpetersenii serovar Hardjo]